MRLLLKQSDKETAGVELVAGQPDADRSKCRVLADCIPMLKCHLTTMSTPVLSLLPGRVGR